MAVRSRYKCNTLFTFSAVAVRLARRMGLHRDGTTLGLSPFETEMRRRLWWHINFMDRRTAEVLGTSPSADLWSGMDVGPPLNVEDEDLYPDMSEPPQERKGITSISLCMIRYINLVALNQNSPAGADGVICLNALLSSDITITKKDSLIDQIEDRYEREYLRYTDPSNKFHTFLSIVARSLICKMRLDARKPQTFASSQAECSRADRDVIFSNSTKLLEYLDMMLGGKAGVEDYTWPTGMTFLWNTVLRVLIEARHRRMGPSVDKAWQMIRVAFLYFPDKLEGPSKSVYAALCRWTLEAWDEHVAASAAEGLPEPQAPDYIGWIRHNQKQATGLSSGSRDAPAEPKTASRGPLDRNHVASKNDQTTIADPEPFAPYEFPDLVSLETDPNEWLQWERLLAEQSAFEQVQGMQQF